MGRGIVEAPPLLRGADLVGEGTAAGNDDGGPAGAAEQRQPPLEMRRVR
jgi:hypothetical protein